MFKIYGVIGLVIILSGCITAKPQDNRVVASTETEKRLPSNENTVVCDEVGAAESNPLRVEFQVIGENEIRDVKVKLSEPGKLSDVFSSDGQSVVAHSSTEKPKYLLGLNVFSIKEENGDHFDFYVVKSNLVKPNFYAYGKVSFDDDASKITRLRCQQK